MDLHEFKPSHVYKPSSRTARAGQRNPVSKTEKCGRDSEIGSCPENGHKMKHPLRGTVEEHSSSWHSVGSCLRLQNSEHSGVIVLPGNV